jgi:hypothetical protein
MESVKNIFYVLQNESFSDKVKKVFGVKISNHNLYPKEHDSDLTYSLDNMLNRYHVNFVNYMSASEGINPDVVLHFDIVRNYKKLIEKNWPNSKHVLILQECEVVKPNNWNLDAHKLFDDIITWNTDFSVLRKYRHIYTIHGFNPEKDLPIKIGVTHKKKLAVLISSNKVSNHPKELYSKRLSCIEWFEQKHKDDFDLYGYGWNRLPAGSGIFTKIAKNIAPISKIVAKRHFVYQGVVPKKKEVLERYKFNIVFENAYLIPGYITEKIFDSFISGTIPIYFGAPNVSDFIPKDCYINMYNFNNYESLYDFIVSMTDDEYIEYQIRIESFLNSSAGKAYSNENYINTVFDTVIKYIN